MLSYPLGDAVKQLADGKLKHRLIQDLRMNGVNLCASLPERQVLPRFVDHAADLSIATADGSTCSALVLDFRHAFMTILASPLEARFNCCLLEEPLRANSLQARPRRT